jgi:hypothetical protein
MSQSMIYCSAIQDQQRILGGGEANMAAEEGNTGIRRTIGRFLLGLVGLFHIGFGPYWFVQEIGVLGRIGRWDIAVTMALLTVLCFVLLFRPSRWAGLLMALVYATWMIFQRVGGL